MSLYYNVQFWLMSVGDVFTDVSAVIFGAMVVLVALNRFLVLFHQQVIEEIT